MVYLREGSEGGVREQLRRQDAKKIDGTIRRERREVGAGTVFYRR